MCIYLMLNYAIQGAVQAFCCTDGGGLAEKLYVSGESEVLGQGTPQMW